MVSGLNFSEIVSFGNLRVVIRDHVTTIMARLVQRHPCHLPLKSGLTPTSDIDSTRCRTLLLPRCDWPHLYLRSTSMIMLIKI